MPCLKSVGVLRVEEQDAVGVGVGVDESGRDGESGGVNDASRAGLGEVTDFGDSLAVDADVGPEGWRSAAIGNNAA